METDVTRRATPLVRLVGFDPQHRAGANLTRGPWFRNPTLATAVATVAAVGAGLEQARSAPGDLDPSFGDVGRVAEPAALAIWSLDVLDDGGTLFGGGIEYCSWYYYAGCYEGSAFGRLLTNGDRDATFSAVQLEDTVIYDTVLQPDGKLVAVGHRGGRLVVVRLLSDGSLDPEFGTEGTVLLPDTTLGSETGRVIELDDDGQIVVAGTRAGQVLLARFDSDGVLDPTFGDGGVAMHGDSVTSVVALARTATGYRVVGNAALDSPASSVSTCQVFGVLPDGSLDTTFGDGGSGTTTLYVNDFGGQTCEAAAAQPDGQLLVGGGPRPLHHQGFLARLLVDGTVDDSFASAPFAGAMRDATAIAVGSAGRIYVAGTRDNGLGGATIVRLLADGTLDMLYGREGLSDLTLRTDRQTSATVRSLAAGPGDTLLVAGSGLWPQGFVARLLGDTPGGGPGVLSMVDAGAFVTEQDGSTTVKVRRLAGSTGAVSVSYRTSPSLLYSSRAQEGEDYTAVTGTLTWADGETDDREIVVPILADSVVETAEFFDIELHSTSGGAGIGATRSEVQIASASYPAGRIRFNNPVFSIREGASGSITVLRDDYAVGEVSVTVRIVGGTAQPGQDFEGDEETTLTWADGDLEPKSFSLQALRDDHDERFETIMLELVSPTGGAVLGTAEARVSILDAPRPASTNGGGHPGVLGTTLLGLLAWWRRRRAGTASAH